MDDRCLPPPSTLRASPATTAVALYDRLPELYRIRDAEQTPRYQLRAFLSAIENAFGAIRGNIGALYQDFFVETCADWVVPYIGDLLGTSHLKGDPRTIRRDVADTIALRRRKGTKAAIQQLVHDLTDWGVHVVELFERLAWAQHLNHQRPDAGGAPPYANIETGRFPRGGTAPIRDPAALSLIDTAFDWTARVVDVKIPRFGNIYYNLPDLAIFLWRLAAYQIPVGRPVSRGVQPAGAVFAARFDLDPLGRPLVLFNTFDYDPELDPPEITHVDGTPGPMVRARLDSHDPMGNPSAYVDLQPYDPANLATLVLHPPHGLRLHFPESAFPTLLTDTWTFRGANLCGWETMLSPPLASNEVVIDPVIGRVVIGTAQQSQANALASDMRVTITYGAVGPVGAHPVSRPPAPTTFDGQQTAPPVFVNTPPSTPTLNDALAGLELPGDTIVVEIEDSEIHDLDPAALTSTVLEGGIANITMARSLIIRAASGQRPIVRLAAPLRFRPVKVLGANPTEQATLDARNQTLRVRLEGLFITPSWTDARPLVSRSAIRGLELYQCTLDPGGAKKLAMTPTRTPPITAFALDRGYDLSPAEQAVYPVTPEIHLCRSISGAIFANEVDEDYLLFLSDSIIDSAGADFAISGDINSAGTAWGPPTQLDCVTFFGRVRVEEMSGRGGIFRDRLEVHDNQLHCLKYCYFSGDHDRLPKNHACVSGPSALLAFTSVIFGEPGYAQLTFGSDEAIRTRGPQSDAMGAFNFLLEAHRWTNLQIRFREFMPVGIKPLLIPLT
jgi:hypothetical protein